MVKRGQISIKICMHSTFGPKSPVEFETFIRKKMEFVITPDLCASGGQRGRSRGQP